MFSKSEKVNLPINFALMFFVHYLTNALITSQRMTFLIRSGYSIQQRSLIFASIPLISITLQFLIGYLSDRFKTIKKIYIVLIIISAISAYAFYSVSTQMFIYHLALTLLSNSVLGSITELGDVWVLESGDKIRGSYGFIRAFGSFGWAVGSFLLAQIILNFGYQGLALISLLFSVILFGIILLLSDEKANIDLENTIETIKLADIQLLFKNKTYLLAIAIIFVIELGASMVNYIIIDKMLLIGGNEWHIGFRLMLAATAEIPLLLAGDYIHRKLDSTNMLIIGALFYTLQFFGYFLANTNSMIFFITALQTVSLPFFTIAIKYLLLEVSPTKLKASGQIIGPALVKGMLGIMFPLISASLASRFSVNAPILLASISGTIGIYLSVHLNMHYKQTKDRRV